MNTFALIITATISFALGAAVVYAGRKYDEKDFEKIKAQRDEAYRLCQKAIDGWKESNNICKGYEEATRPDKDLFGGF